MNYQIKMASDLYWIADEQDFCYCGWSNAEIKRQRDKFVLVLDRSTLIDPIVGHGVEKYSNKRIDYKYDSWLPHYIAEKISGSNLEVSFGRYEAGYLKGCTLCLPSGSVRNTHRRSYILPKNSAVFLTPFQIKLDLPTGGSPIVASQDSLTRVVDKAEALLADARAKIGLK